MSFFLRRRWVARRHLAGQLQSVRAMSSSSFGGSDCIDYSTPYWTYYQSKTLRDAVNHGDHLMFSQQDALPRLPIPTLTESVSRFLSAIAPLSELSPEEFAEAEQCARAFETCKDTIALQKELHELDAQLASKGRDSRWDCSSYVGSFWESMYLEGRWALMPHSNPGGWLSEKPFLDRQLKLKEAGGNTTIDNIQAHRCALQLAATLDLKDRISSFTLPPDVFNKTPLDMRQYTRMFCGSRIARPGRDLLVQADPKDVRHVVVLSGNKIYAVDVIDKNGRNLSVENIQKQLERVIDDVRSLGTADTDSAVGAFTTMDREEWAEIRMMMERCSEKNRANLSTIDSAILAVCLDTEDIEGVPGTTEYRNNAVRAGLHGDCKNRWFDKGMTMAFSKNGVLTYSFEHSWGDGLASLRWGDECAAWVASADLQAEARTFNGELSDVDEPLRMDWDLSEDLKDSLLNAHTSSVSLVENLSLETSLYTEWGKRNAKQWKCSPDGLVQQAIQLAYHKVHQECMPTYESASTQAFSGGRTETIRSASTDGRSFVLSCANEDEDDIQQQAALLRQAAKTHGSLARNAASGKGFDRHLYVLHQLAVAKAKAGRDDTCIPALFKTRAYEMLSRNTLSTSTVSSPIGEQSAFGPVDANGYGVMYHIFDDELRFCVTSYPPQSATAFKEALESSLDYVGKLLERAS